MNIFYLDESPRLAAQYHNQSHCVKMILETCQLLSTAHHVLDGPKPLIYKPTHINHPSSKWVRTNDKCYEWAGDLLGWLCAEFKYRNGKTHKSESIGLVEFLMDNKPTNIPTGIFVPPFIAINSEFIDNNITDTVQQYRNYYKTTKRRLACWDGTLRSRQKPEWY